MTGSHCTISLSGLDTVDNHSPKMLILLPCFNRGRLKTGGLGHRASLLSNKFSTVRSLYLGSGRWLELSPDSAFLDRRIQLKGVGIMRNLVRGGIILVILSLCVVFILAQTRPAKVLSIANDSQKAETSNTTASNITTNSNNSTTDTSNKLVKTTGMVSAARAASRGSFVATAYCLKGRTAIGSGVRRGIIAADPGVLKLGSQVLLGAGSYTGQYTVADTGGGVRGRRIDIWVPSCSEARRFGRRTVLVSMVEK
jgi:3D (Asp-Asp-Asp) domain-containing protein